MDSAIEKPIDVLKRYWGYDTFRPQQESIIQALLDGQDVWARLATGAGKSICFQVPTLCFEKGLCVVVSPLIALMQDQVRLLVARGLRASALDAGMYSAQWDRVLRGCEGGQTRFLYITAERVADTAFLERLKPLNVRLMVVDEAHCISEWGHDFRPAYQQLAQLRDVCPKVPILALSASAPEAVSQDIKQSLRLRNPLEIKGELTRPNLSYAVRRETHIEPKLVHMLHRKPGSALIYVAARKQSEEWTQRLQKKGFSVRCYHAGLSLEERKRNQTEWLQNKTRILVCTNAFGMGIDKADVRWVIHLSPPYHLAAYVQESGRAGRDKKRAFALILNTPNAIQYAAKRIQQQTPDLKILMRTYDALYNYAKIALGSGQWYSCKLPIQEFAKTYQIPPKILYYAIEELAYAGLIQLDTRGCPSSRALILEDKTELYRFQIKHEKHAPVLDAILRRYSGIFTNYCLIHETQLAKDTRMPVQDVIQTLKRAHEAQLISYLPKHSTPLLTFLHPRQLAKDLPLNEKNIQKRQQQKTQAFAKVESYLLQTTGCRQQNLAKALDAPIDSPCGVCDLCLNKKNLPKN